MGIRVLAVLIISCTFSLFACAHSEVSGNMAMKECAFHNFSKLSEEDRRKVISQCDPEQQVDLYLAWSSATIPSNTDYAKDIAKSGDKVLPALLERLERRGLADEINKPELLIVLDIMQRAGYYPVAEDKKLMARVERAADSMKEAHLKEWALDIVSQIESDAASKASSSRVRTN